MKLRRKPIGAWSIAFSLISTVAVISKCSGQETPVPKVGAGELTEKLSGDEDIPAPLNPRRVPANPPGRVPPPKRIPNGVNRQILINDRAPGQEPGSPSTNVYKKAVNLRRIRVEHQDYQLEIHDSPNSKIKMKLIKKVAGVEQITEFEADDIHELNRARPELCRLYEKYTGLKSDPTLQH